jgi:hypothetical protein
MMDNRLAGLIAENRRLRDAIVDVVRQLSATPDVSDMWDMPSHFTYGDIADVIATLEAALSIPMTQISRPPDPPQTVAGTSSAPTFADARRAADALVDQVAVSHTLNLTHNANPNGSVTVRIEFLPAAAPYMPTAYAAKGE